MSDKLTGPQRLALEALLSGASKPDAAEIAGRTERTVNRWVTGDPAFRAALDEASAEAIDEGGRRLALMLNLATKRLHDVLANPTANPGLWLRAADLVVNHMIRLREHGDIEERIAKLEQRIGNGK